MNSPDATRQEPTFAAALERYATFDLFVTLEPEGSRWRVSHIDDGRLVETRVAAPFEPGELDDLLERLGWSRSRDARREEAEPRAAAIEIGERLYRALFAAEVGRCWRAARRRAREEASGLRLQLHGPELDALPWELLCDPESRTLLAASVETPLSRVPGKRAERRLQILVEPLRVLVVVAAGDLDVDAEIERIDDALKPMVARRRVVLEVLRRPSADALRARLRDSESPVHVLHFIGHGRYDPDQGEGWLRLADGAVDTEGVAAEPEEVDAGRLARWIDGSAIRFVVLNACESARHAGSTALRGVSEALVQQRVPAVLAMKARIADDVAIGFAAALYRALAAEAPVDVAVAAARSHVLDQWTTNEWALPALYLHSENAQLFSLTPRRRRRWELFPAGAVVGGLVAALVAWWFWPPPASDPRCPSPRGIHLPMVFVAADAFYMGSDERSDERPIHLQTVEQDFCIGQYEVTREQWGHFMGDDVPEFREDGAANEPVRFVSWNRANKFIEALNRASSGDPFDLPTEVQWEYAARAGSEDLFFFGDDPELLHYFGNCRNPVSDDYEDAVAPVGSFNRNDWHLYDVHGNVSELTKTIYRPYAEGPPKPEELEEIRYVRRGGSFDVIPDSCRLARRFTIDSEWVQRDVGLRIVRTALELDDIE
ncbi:MAG: SUMF1/EgtB/PvdO family nonheme iron enzyme [Acidobacteriota bacterium]